MKKMLVICMLSFGLVLSWSITCFGDFYVIPVKQKNFAPVQKTSQETCYNESGAVIGCTNTGQDGDIQAGVEWPDPRLEDNDDGTVTDNLTGFLWLKDASCFVTRTWASALSQCNTLNNGECGLTDGSVEGDWRLPNRFELESVLDMGESLPALPSGHPFSDVVSGWYWSSTTYDGVKSFGWSINMAGCQCNRETKTKENYVWCVRGSLY